MYALIVLAYSMRSMTVASQSQSVIPGFDTYEQCSKERDRASAYLFAQTGVRVTALCIRVKQ